MGRIIAVGNQKGGVCKTTSAANMGWALMQKGYKVLFVDCDPQADLTFTLKGNQNDKTLMDVLEGSISAEDAIQHTENGDLLASCANMSSVDMKLADPGTLREKLNPMKDLYDFIIIDTPRALARLAINAFTAADDILVTCTSDVYTLNAVKQLTDTVGVIHNKSNPNVRVCGILLCRQDARTNISREIEELLRARSEKQFGTKVYNTVIRQGKHIREAALMQTDLFRYAPTSNPAIDYMAFTEEYLKDIN